MCDPDPKTSIIPGPSVALSVVPWRILSACGFAVAAAGLAYYAWPVLLGLAVAGGGLVAVVRRSRRLAVVHWPSMQAQHARRRPVKTVVRPALTRGPLAIPAPKEVTIPGVVLSEEAGRCR